MPGSESRTRLETASWLAVVRAYQECNRRYGALLREFDLTIAQFDALNAIRNLGDAVSPNQIAAELVVTRGNVTGLLRRLEEGGLIATAENSDDGRSIHCFLSRRGRDTLTKARAAAARFIAAQLSPFDDALLRSTRDHMEQMRQHLTTIEPRSLAAEPSKAQGDRS